MAYAVFLAPAVSTDLLGVHASLHGRFARFGTGAWDHDREGTRVPHCTPALGRR
jgi:hypothetical protein